MEHKRVTDSFMIYIRVVIGASDERKRFSCTVNRDQHRKCQHHLQQDRARPITKPSLSDFILERESTTILDEPAREHVYGSNLRYFVYF
jgi:hypothetical protein